ncbi:MAG: alpha/beta hydrolase [Vicingaceae bacterium]
MKKLYLAFVILFNSYCSAQTLGEKEAKLKGLSKEFKMAQEMGEELINLFIEDEIEYLHEQFFSESLAEQLSVDKLESTRSKILKKDGQFEGILSAKLKRKAKKLYYLRGFALESQIYDLQFSLDEDDKLTSLFLTQSVEFQEWQMPEDVDLEKITIKDIEVGAEKPLLGEIIQPKGIKDFPIVVMVHGSGQNDMDESLGPNKLFKDLAYSLAMNGIGSIRYNKRTYEYTSDLIKNYTKSNFRTIVDEDAKLALELAKKNTEGKIILLGHSLGGHLAPRIIEGEKVDGVIVMAGNSSHLKDLLLPQFEYLMENDSTTSINQFQLTMLKTQLKNLNTENYDSSTVGPLLPLGLPAVFWMDLKNYKPVKIAKDQKLPYLVISGERDYQVPPSETKGWSAALNHPYSKMKVYPKLNHMFFAGEGLCLPAEYQEKAHLDLRVQSDIIRWIKGL